MWLGGSTSPSTLSPEACWLGLGVVVWTEELAWRFNPRIKLAYLLIGSHEVQVPALPNCHTWVFYMRTLTFQLCNCVLMHWINCQPMNLSVSVILDHYKINSWLPPFINKFQTMVKLANTDPMYPYPITGGRKLEPIPASERQGYTLDLRAITKLTQRRTIIHTHVHICGLVDLMPVEETRARKGNLCRQDKEPLNRKAPAGWQARTQNLLAVRWQCRVRLFQWFLYIRAAEKSPGTSLLLVKEPL